MYEIYNVLNNDTLESIAKKYNTNIDNILNINGFIKNYNPIPGTSIIVPTTSNKPYIYYTVKKGETIYQISKQNNIDYNTLLKINGLDKDDYIYPNQTILIPNKKYKIYSTTNKDTLKDISETLNISPNRIIEENPNIELVRDQIIVFKEK